MVRRWNLGASACCVLAVALIAGGCASTRGLSSAVSDYHEGRYASGYEGALAVLRQSGGSERDRASYLAGLCAYRLAEMPEAELRFRMAETSSDAATAARARAMLGVMLMDQDRDAEAAELLERASAGLEGEDAREASSRASMARRRSAGGPPAEPAGRAAALVGRDGGRFTLQAGAFRQRSRAETTARGLERLARDHDLGPVRVVPTFDSRRQTLYLVQVGHFDTRREAATVRQRLGRMEYIVAVGD